MDNEWIEEKYRYIGSINSIMLDYAKILEELKTVSTEEEFKSWHKKYLEV